MATVASSTNYYGSVYVNTVCETQTKSVNQGLSGLAVALVLVSIAVVAVNNVVLEKLNRLHAIARGDVYSPLLGKDLAKPHETPALFLRWVAIYTALKTVVTVGVCVGMILFIQLVETRSAVSTDAAGVLQGGSLLSRYGAPCEGARMQCVWVVPFFFCAFNSSCLCLP